MDRNISVSGKCLHVKFQSSSTVGYQSVVLGPAASASPGNLLGMHIPGSTLDLLNQKLWGGAQKPAL